MIRYQLVEQTADRAIDDDAIGTLASLMQACFGEAPADFAGRVREKLKAMALLAFDDAEPVAFKLGYARDRATFYSWLGGVVASHRQRGIAAELLRRQHARCRELGYRAVTTMTLHDNRAMLITNLRAGFAIHGTELDDRGLKVWLRVAL